MEALRHLLLFAFPFARSFDRDVKFHVILCHVYVHVHVYVYVYVYVSNLILTILHIFDKFPRGVYRTLQLETLKWLPFFCL